MKKVIVHLLALSGLVVHTIHAQYAVSWSTHSMGGSEATSGSTKLISTVGQTLAGSDQSGIYTIAGGFLPYTIVSSNSITVGFDATNANAAVQSGDSVLVSCSPSSLTGAAVVRLYYRQGGESGFAYRDMIASGATFSQRIPSNVITSRGVDYYIQITDVDKSGRSPFSGYYSKPVIVANLSPASSISSQMWNIISVPIVPENADASTVLSNFGSISPKNWRLFRWVDDGNAGTEQDYKEYGASGFETFAPGRSFWLISAGAHPLTVSGTSLSASNSYDITLKPGWNMIACPFNFKVSWSDVVGRTSDIGTPFRYDNGFSGTNVLEPWKGYFVNNGGSSDVVISVPPISTATLEKEAEMGADEWEVAISAVSGRLKDSYNFIGARHESSVNFDQYDLIDPPKQPDEYLTLYFPHRDWSVKPNNYCKDIQPLSSEGYVWDFEVQSQLSASRVTLRWTEGGRLPANAYLVDKDLGIAQPWNAGGSYDYVIIPKAVTTRRFRVIVGDESFFASNSLGVKLSPTEFSLSANFPNPFNPMTAIKFQLPLDSETDLRVYNVLGQEVRKLQNGIVASGYHVALWDGRDNSSKAVASGIYIYRLTARSVDGTKSFTQSRKMLLVK